jgi:hypothetical protein
MKATTRKSTAAASVPRRTGNARRSPPRRPLDHSVLQLARQIAALDAKSWGPRFDPPIGAPKPEAMRELDTIIDQIESLQALAFTVPAFTLADAAGHLVLALNEIAFLEDYMIDSGESALWRYRNVARALASALPIVADAAGVGLGEIATPWAAAAREREFPTTIV